MSIELTLKTTQVTSSTVYSARRLARGISWSLVGSVVAQASAFGVNILLARLLGTKEFGAFAIVQSTVALLSQFAGLAMGSTATKFIAEYQSFDPGRAGRILGLCSTVSFLMGGVATTALIAGAPWLTMHVLKAPEICGAMRLGAGALFFSILAAYQMGALAGLEGFRVISRARLFNGLQYLLYCGVGAWLFGLRGAITGLVMAMVMQWVILKWLLRVECHEKSITICRKEVWRERKIISNFALPAALNGLITSPTIWLAQVVLARQPDGFSQIGIYTAAANLTAIVRLIPGLIDNVSTVIINDHKGRREGLNFKKAFRLNLFLVVISVLVFGPVILLLSPIVLNWYGHTFAVAVPALKVLLLALVLEVAATAIYQIVRSHERMWSSFFLIAIPQNVVLLVASYLLSPRLGPVGLAWACVASWAVSLVSIGLVAYRTNLGFDPKNGNVAR